MSERDDILDFPGADQLILAGEVAPPSRDKLAAVRTLLAQVAERDARLLRGPNTWEVPNALAHDAEVVHAAARRDGPTAALAPPSEEPVVVLAHGDLGEPDTRLRRSRVTRGRRLLIAAAAVAAIAAGAVAYPVLDVGGKPASTASAASAFLNDMAAVSADSSAPDAKYWKMHYKINKLGKGAEKTETRYIDRAGRVWRVDEHGKVRATGLTMVWQVGENSLTWSALDNLPTDPKQLTRLLPKEPAKRFSQVCQLLEYSPASPALRSALFRIIADTRSVTLTPGLKDSTGRSGTAVQFSHEFTSKDTQGRKVTMTMPETSLIDPKTARVLESTHSNRNKAVQPYSRTWLEVGPADHLG